MMEPFSQWFYQDITQKVEIRHCESVVFTGDEDSMLVGVHLLKNNAPLDVTGEACTCYAVRADMATVGPITGTVDGNDVSALLDRSALAVRGPLAVSLKVGKITVLKAIFTADFTTTDSIVDPGHVIPSIEELLEKLDEMIAGTEAANEAAQAANTAAGTANTAADGANTAAASANSAAQAANTAAGGANTAAAAATSAASAANTAAANAPTQITSQATAYQNSASGTVIPGGQWLDTQPETPQGQFLWIRKTLTWNNGQESVLYSVSRMGVDGAGSVSSVNGISPDAGGNVTLPVDTTPASGSSALITSGAVFSALSARGAVLLWENPAPTSDFAAQTITLSQSAANFDYLMFVVISNKNQSAGYYVWTAGNNAGQTQLSCFALNQQANPNNGYHLMLQQRVATVNETSVAITKSIYFRTDANSAWVGDARRQDLCIPLKIYGMKF